VTYSQLIDEADNLSVSLFHAGCPPQGRVAVFLPNGIGFIEAVFAAIRSGGVAVPLNVNFQEADLKYHLQHSNARLMITDKARFSRIQPILENLESPPQVVILEEIAPVSSRVLPEGAVNPDKPALLQYSTGSTGQSKPVIRTQGQLMAEADHFVRAVEVTQKDRVLAVVPLFHAHGFGNCLLASLMNGATLVVLEGFNPREVLTVLQQEKVTIFPGVPFMFKILAETRHKDPLDLSRLHLCFSAGAALDPEVSRRFHGRFGIYVRQLYGSTETGSVTINLDPDIGTTLESVGKPMFPVQVAIFDESGDTLPPGVTGEIGISSPATAEGYEGVPKETEASFRKGFFFSGDIGRLDSQGRLYITGRKTFFINVGGNKVDPAEVEEVISSHPKVKEVVAMGVDDPDADQVVKVVIVPKNSCEAKEIIEYCGRKMAVYKIPRIIEFRAKIPKSPLGKVLRKYLQEN
jgi:long-chain acyl-CoA synthetase